jgi:hypothetical protein
MNSPAAGPALFKDVAFVVYPVKDVKLARAFYEGPLGLTVTANWDDQWVEYDIGDGTLAITAADATHQAGAHGATVGLEVVDLDAVLSHLETNRSRSSTDRLIPRRAAAASSAIRMEMKSSCTPGNSWGQPKEAVLTVCSRHDHPIIPCCWPPRATRW